MYQTRKSFWWQFVLVLNCHLIWLGFKFFVLFSFHFQILHKHCISLFLNIFEFLVLKIRYQQKQIFSTCFIWFQSIKEDIKKRLKSKIPSFVWRIWKWKEKRTKQFDLPERGFELQIFSNFPTLDLNFHGKWSPRSY